MLRLRSTSAYLTHACDRAAPQRVVPRDYYSDLSDATNDSHLDVGMVEKRGWLNIDAQLDHKYALSVDGNTASTRLQMLLAADQVIALLIMRYLSGCPPIGTGIEC